MAPALKSVLERAPLLWHTCGLGALFNRTSCVPGAQDATPIPSLRSRCVPLCSPLGVHEGDWERVSVLVCAEDLEIQQVRTGTLAGCKPAPWLSLPVRWPGVPREARGTFVQRFRPMWCRGPRGPVWPVPSCFPATVAAACPQVSYSQHGWWETRDCTQGKCTLAPDPDGTNSSVLHPGEPPWPWMGSVPSGTPCARRTCTHRCCAAVLQQPGAKAQHAASMRVGCSPFTLPGAVHPHQPPPAACLLPTPCAAVAYSGLSTHANYFEESPSYVYAMKVGKWCVCFCVGWRPGGSNMCKPAVLQHPAVCPPPSNLCCDTPPSLGAECSRNALPFCRTFRWEASSAAGRRRVLSDSINHGMQRGRADACGAGKACTLPRSRPSLADSFRPAHLKPRPPQALLTDCLLWHVSPPARSAGRFSLDNLGGVWIVDRTIADPDWIWVPTPENVKYLPNMTEIQALPEAVGAALLGQCGRCPRRWVLHLQAVGAVIAAHGAAGGLGSSLRAVFGRSRCCVRTFSSPCLASTLSARLNMPAPVRLWQGDADADELQAANAAFRSSAQRVQTAACCPLPPAAGARTVGLGHIPRQLGHQPETAASHLQLLDQQP